jgi:multiple sugar transport system ATP-binding protein
MAEIQVKNLQKKFGDFTAVKDVSFTIPDESFFCLLGSSGCGKTTTLRMIAGLELPTSGSIYLSGEDVAQKRASERDIAFVFQLFALYPHMNVRKNIAFPLLCQGVPASEVKARVEETARLLRIDHILDKSVSGLAGGDRQRVALGRAIVRRPMAFLMDEPLGTLDAEFRDLMCEELKHLHKRIKATTVYVTHDQLEAMSMADYIAIMNRGVIEQLASPQVIYDRPATMYVAEFVGSPSMNFLRFNGSIDKGKKVVNLGSFDFAVPQMREAFEGDMAFGVRPEHIRLSDKSKYRAEVKATEYLGTTQIVTLKTHHGVVKARAAASDVARVGETVGLEFEGKTVTLFDTQSGRALRSELNEGVLAHG